MSRLRSARRTARRNPAALRTAGPGWGPPNPGRRSASPTHLLQKFGHIVHLVVQDQPGAPAVVVPLDLLQGVVLDGLVRLLGHFGTRGASGPADTSRARRSTARLNRARVGTFPTSRAPRPGQGNRHFRGGGVLTASGDWPESMSLQGPALDRHPPPAPVWGAQSEC